MFTTFVAITQPFIKTTQLKNNTRVLALIMIYETISDKISYIVLSCIIYTTIKNYVYIDYLACQYCFK